MKLLYLLDNINTGGISSVSATKINYLLKIGYRVGIVCTHYTNDSDCIKFDSKLERYNISLNSLNIFLHIPIIGRIIRYFYFRLKLLSIYISFNPDIIISTFDHLEPFCIILLTFWKKRILELHGERITTNRPRFRKWLRIKLKYRFYTLVTLTRRDKDIRESILGGNYLVIPNPLSHVPNTQSDCESKIVIIPARLTEQKGLVPFLPYWKGVQDKHPDWQLHIYGEGPEKEKLEHIISDSGLHSVSIFPFTNCVISKFSESSIFIMPSLYEGFPIILLEAMSCGVPCVAYDCPCGPSDIVTNDEDGFIVEHLNPTQMVEKINFLIENPEIRKQMGAEARVNIQRFDIDNIMSQWISLFNNLLK